MNNKALLVGGIGLGAALMYFFDPDRGRRRRALIRDKCEGAANKTGDYVDKMSRDLRNRAQGLIAETKSIFQHEEVTDDVLVDRVRSKLGRFPVQGGAIDVTANNGIINLRGRVLAHEVPNLLRAVRSVRGVTDIDNQLEVNADEGSESSLRDTPPSFGTQLETASDG